MIDTLQATRNNSQPLMAEKSNLSALLKIYWLESKNKRSQQTRLSKGNISNVFFIPRKIPKSIEEVAPIDRLPVVGYQGFRPVYRPPRREGTWLVMKFNPLLSHGK